MYAKSQFALYFRLKIHFHNNALLSSKGMVSYQYYPRVNCRISVIQMQSFALYIFW